MCLPYQTVFIGQANSFSSSLSSLSFVRTLSIKWNCTRHAKRMCVCSVYVASWCWWNVHCRRALNKFSSFRQRKMKKKEKKTNWIVVVFNIKLCNVYIHTSSNTTSTNRFMAPSRWNDKCSMANAQWITVIKIILESVQQSLFLSVLQQVSSIRIDLNR